MGILDFTEIPPANANNKYDEKNIDGFELFAQEFFGVLYDAEFIECATRGQDGGRDLLFLINEKGVKEKWAVSCKHNAYSLNPIGLYQEKKFYDTLVRTGADKLILFYSHTATSSLELELLETKRNREIFDFEIFNGDKIESKLLSSKNGKGWFLASRYFPKSFLRLFERFLCPINHYSEEDVIVESKNSIRISGPGGARVTFPEGQNIKKEITELIEYANERVTLSLHEAYFAKVLTEITQLWPSCFSYWGACPSEEIDISKIYPTFCKKSILEILRSENRYDAMIVCLIWTWWDEKLAHSIFHEAYIEQYGSLMSKENTRSILNISTVVGFCNLEKRNLVTRMVAFGHGNLSELTPWDKVAITTNCCGLRETLHNVLEDLYQQSSTQFGFDSRISTLSTIQKQLHEYASILGFEHVQKSLEPLFENLPSHTYLPFETLVQRKIKWTINTTFHFEWYNERINRS